MELGSALLVFIGLVLGARVVFEVGSCYTMPIQLAFVPALFVLPPALGPAACRRGARRGPLVRGCSRASCT